MQVMVALWMAGLFLAAIVLGLLLYLFVISVSKCSRVKLPFDTLVICTPVEGGKCEHSGLQQSA